MLRPQMRSDVHRHAILRKWGGLWLDADVRVVRDPAEWTAGWDRYTAVRLDDGGAFIGTDIIYVPASWSGWPLIDAHIERTLTEIATTRRVKMLALASRMIESCHRELPDAFAFLDPGTRYPFGRDSLTTESVVARGFDPSTVTPQPAPGLGDMIASGLSAVGITKPRAQAVARAVGFKDCGCGKRQKIANAIGAKYLGLPPGNSH